jgi:hypothetical protein
LHTGTTEFLKEANIMQNIEHENIVRMYGVLVNFITCMNRQIKQNIKRFHKYQILHV